MGEKGETNRQRIVQAADDLFYQKGYEATSFSDIAEAVGIARGNFYYYFKTKNDILVAVLQKRRDDIRAMLDEWDKEYPEPRARLKRYILILVKSQSEIENFGCPVGSLCTELNKLRHALHGEATEMFEIFRLWLEKQFAGIGHKKDAHKLALRLMARCQGVSLITSAYSDVDFLHREVEELQQWIEGL